jgi:hypothetical protein
MYHINAVKGRVVVKIFGREGWHELHHKTR